MRIRDHEKEKDKSTSSSSRSYATTVCYSWLMLWCGMECWGASHRAELGIQRAPRLRQAQSHPARTHITMHEQQEPDACIDHTGILISGCSLPRQNLQPRLWMPMLSRPIVAAQKHSMSILATACSSCTTIEPEQQEKRYVLCKLSSG